MACKENKRSGSNLVDCYTNHNRDDFYILLLSGLRPCERERVQTINDNSNRYLANRTCALYGWDLFPSTLTRLIDLLKQ